MMKQQPHKTVKNHERKVIQGIGRKFLASSLCALLSVSNGLNWPVLATEAETDPEVVEQQPMEDETEIVSEEENPTVGNEQGLCVHHPWHDAQCGTDPCQYRCVPCLQEDIAEIIAILTEESAEEDPLQAVYTRIEHAYDTYVALNEDELAQLEEDEYAFMEAVLRQEESIIQSLDALDQQVDENGQAEAQTLTQLYQEVAAAYGAFMEEKAGQETKPDEEQDPVEEGEQPKKVITMDDDNKDSSQKENEKESGTAEGDEAPDSTTPDATEKKMKITAVSIKDDSGVQHLIGMSNSTENQESEGDQTQPIIKKEFSINHAKQIALHLEVESQLNLKDKKVEITIPDGLVVVEYPKPDSTTGMVKSVTPERAEDLKGTGDYGVYQPQSGTITYALKDTAEKTSFNIILALDTTLWNKTTPTNRDAFTILSDAIMIRTYSGMEEDGINYDSFSATAKVSGDVLATGPVLSKTKPKNTNLATESTDPFKLTDFRYRPDRSMMTLGTFFKEFSLTIPLPKNTKKNYYASLVYIESDRGYFSYNDPKHPENKPDVEEEKDHVTLTWKNIYIPEDEYFMPYFVWKQGETLAPDESVQWDLTSIKSDLKDWKNNNSSLASFELSPLTFTGSNTSDVLVNSVGRGKSLSLYGMTDVLCYLGKIDIDGAGTKKTGPMKLEYTYDNTNGFIGVVAQKIPAPVGAKVTNIQYKTNKKEQFQTLEDQTSTEGFIALTIADLGLSDDEYFTAITAVVDGYDPDFTSDITPRLTNPAGAKSAIFGRVLKNDLIEENKKINIATLKVTPIVDGEEKAESLKTKTLELSICGTTENDQIPLGLTNAVNPNNPEEKLPILDKVLCTAGDEVHFNGVMMVSSYPYTTHNVLNDLEVYIRLPKSVSVQDLVFYKQTGSTADSILLEQNAVENGIITRGEEIIPLKMEELPEESEYVTTKFTFDKDVIVGWFGKDFSQYQVGISFTMKIDKGADAMTLDMRECVKFKTEKWQAVSDKGSVSNSTIQVGETYYGTLNVNAQNTKLSVTAARQGLTFDFGAKLCDDTNCSGKDYKNNYVNYDKDNEKVFLKDKDHGMDLRMIIKNETKKIFLGEAKDFYYYIPVPKKGDNWDTHMQEMDFDFDMIMTGPVKVEGSSGHNIHVQYSTTVESKVGLENPHHYNNTDHLKDNYKDADEIDDWSKVKMIRISTNDGVVDISADAEVEIYAHFETAKDASDLVGSKINFGPCGYSPYTVGTADNGGHMPLPHIQIEFQTGIIAGKVFVDENKNGQMDDGEPLYTGKLTIKAPHGTEIASDAHESHEVTVENGEFKFEGRRADTYFLEVVNPGSPDANGKNPLKFSIPETSKFQEVEEGKSAKATIIVNAKNSAENQSLILGLQTPHTIHFEIPDSNATMQSNTMYVWNNETLGKSVPLVAPKSGWKFMDLWTLKGEDAKVTQQYTTEELSKLPVTKNMTFVPQLKKIYTVTYDGNGHTSGELSTENEFYTENDLVALRNFSELKTSNSNVICVGWSTEKITDVLTADAEQSLINKVIKEHEYTMPTRNVVFYAVWAEDLNGNGSPDYSDNAVHVRYHSNTEKEMVVQCLHHHLQGKEAILSSTAASINGKKRITANPEQWEGQSGTYSFEKEQAVFLGWSESASPKDVDTMNDYNAIFGEGKKPLTKVIMDTNGKDVYAVWGTDRNKNGVADYQERVRVIYDGNSTNLVSNLPENEQDHIPGDIVALKNSPKPTHSDLDGKKVVFIGWSEKPLSILKREDAVPNVISKITLGSGDATVYAVWGYDSDDDGKADVLDTYALTYDLNGGKPKDGVRLPEKQENIPKGTNVPLSAETQFKRNENEVFIGWSKEKHEDAFTAAQGSAINDMLITGKEIIIEHEDVTLYAVWAKDSNANSKPDYKELVKLIYNGNPQSQGTVNKSLLDSVHIPGDTVSLKMSPKPTHSNVDGKRVVFMGWTRNPSTKIYEPKDSVENLNLASQVTFDKDKNHDITVYAAWGYDSDAEGETGYGVADVMEQYTLRYDLNGGKGTLPSSRNDLKKNQKVDVASGSFTREALETFIGWSKTRYPAAVSKTPEDLLKPGSSIAVNAHTTIYAVWADDKNGNGTPDGEDEALHVTYHSNTEQEKAENCTHHHVAGETCALSATAQALGFAKENAVWIGWSKTRTDLITTAAGEKKAELVDQFTLQETGNDVYAVWAADKNKNGTPDYEEDGYQILYNANNESGLVVQCGHHHVNGEIVKLYTPKENLFGSEKDIPATAPYTFTMDNAVLMGWSQTPVNSIIQTEEEFAKVPVVENVPVKDSHVQVYAVWAVDKNNNAIPDWKEKNAVYSLNYDPNTSESVENMPELSQHLAGEKVKLNEKIPTREERNGIQILFAGWSETQSTNVLMAGSKAPEFVSMDLFVMPAKATTLYAIWAEDRNGNGIADYLERSFRLEYDANPIQDKVQNMPKNSEHQVPGELVALQGRPTHEPVESKAVVFLGWTLEPTRNIYEAKDRMPQTIQTIRFGSENVKVYAAWGYDSNEDGTADVLDTYSVTYDLNDGRGTAPQETAHKAGEKFPMRHSADLTKQDAVFAGWSVRKISGVLDENADTKTIESIITADEYEMPAQAVTFYAVWAKDANANGKPDYADNAVHVRYHSNNGENLDVICPHHHVVGANAKLSTTANTIWGSLVSHGEKVAGKIEAHAFKKDNAVFVGWSTRAFPADIKTQKEYDALQAEIFTEMEMKRTGNDVYAVWAVDLDGDKVPDYEKEYLVTYAGNGQSAGQVPPSANYQEGDVFPIAYTSDLQKEGAIFAGWSENQIETILKADTEQALIRSIVTQDTYTMPNRNVTFYAVWAEDKNGDLVPDYAEHAVQVRYHANLGQSEEAVICPHHHIVGTDSELSSAAEHLYGRTETDETIKNHSFQKENAVFIGWSEQPVSQDIQTMAELKTLTLLSKVTMQADGNDVYAVWAADTNQNGVPDYQEQIHLLYDANGGHPDSVPVDTTNYFAGTNVQLANKPVPAHDDIDGVPVRFIGWTKDQAQAIFKRGDEAPTTIDAIRLDRQNVTVFAAWGYDENKDGTADVLETYTLSYDLNEGRGKAPQTQKGMRKGEEINLPQTREYTRNANEVFAGWSWTVRPDALTAADKEEAERLIVRKATMPAQNSTLYAVWANDRNGNDIADYLERPLALVFEPNAQAGGTVWRLPAKETGHILGETVSLSQAKPVHDPVKKKAVVFVGWTRKPVETILSRLDTPPETIDKVTFGSQDLRVFAAWGYDEDGDGKADVLDTYTLAYDANGGTGFVPRPQAGMAKGERVSLPKEADLTRADDEVWIGWSLKPYEAAFSATEGSQAQTALLTADSFTMPSANQTLYAVWAQDQNQNGVADFEEMVHVRYAKNAAEGGSVHGMPSASIHLPGDVAALSLKTPTYTDNDGRRVLFLGWTREAHAIYTRQDPDSTSALLREIELGKRDVTVYAAWGYDANKDGKADVFETYSLTYDLNGGTGRVPAPQTNIGKGTILALTKEKNFSRHEGETFAGWSRQKLEQAVDDGQSVGLEGKELEMGAEDVTLYAVWKRDPNAIIRYTVSYDLNGDQNVASASYAPETMPAGTVYRVQTAPARQGYAFTGWKTNDGKIVQPFDSLTITGNIQLTAQWRKEGGSAQAGRTPSSRKPSARAARWTDTGQATRRALWMTLLGASGLVAAFLAYRKKQKRK